MEFQAVVFCKESPALEPICVDSHQALLRVANKPILDYTIEWCERASLRSIILCTPKNRAEEFKAHLANRKGIEIEVLEVDDNCETGDALLLAAPRLTRDFVLLSCNFITDIEPQVLIDMHRTYDDSVLISGFYYKNTFESIESKKVLTPDVLIHSRERDSRLLDTYTRQIVKANKKLNVRMAMLWKFPDVLISTDVLATSLYFCRRQVLDIILGKDEHAPIKAAGRPVATIIRDFARRTWQHSTRLEEVSMFHLPAASTFIRINNLPAFMEANRFLMKLNARHMAKPSIGNAHEKDKALIGLDSLLGKNSIVGVNSSIKRSVVGDNSTIGRKCRINGCVLLDGVTVGDDVWLENCILGKNVDVQSHSRLVGCDVQTGTKVAAGTEAKNEVLKSAILNVDVEYEDLFDTMSEDESDTSEDDDADAYGNEGNDSYDDEDNQEKYIFDQLS